MTSILTTSIKSFVRRSGRLTPGQKKALDLYWLSYGIGFRDSLLDIDALMGQYKALKLEIGIGNGDALTQMAVNDPGSLYLGIEVHQPGIGRCLNTIAGQQIPNIRLLSHDAVAVMQKMLPAQSLDRILLFFPDPWPKKRHHKRRIMNPPFLDSVAHLLKPGACLHCATDWWEYAESMAVLLLSDPRFLSRGGASAFSQRPVYRPVTHFEERGRNLGHGVWDLIFKKR